MAVAYDATATGTATGAGSSFSLSITASAGADVFCGISIDRNSAPATTPQYNGTTMTLVDSQLGNASTLVGSVYLYRAAGAGTGSPANITGTFPSCNWTVGGASTTGVSTVGAAIKAHGQSAALSSGSVTLTTGQLALCLLGGCYFGAPATLGTVSGGTPVSNASASSDSSLAISYATSTATFASTASASTWWATLAVVLSPAAGVSVSPATATVAITGGTPTATLSNSPTVAPAHGSVALTPGTPTVSFTTNVNVSPASATIKIIGGNPSPFGAVLSKLAAGQSVVIQVMGDSTANGYGDTLTGGWVARMGTILGTFYNVTAKEYTYNGSNGYNAPATLFTGGGANTISMFNAGIDGSSLSGEETWINSFGLLGIQDGFPTPDVVIVYDGYNDIGFTAGSQTSSTTWVSEYQAFLTSYMLTYFPHIPIVCCTQHLSFLAAQSGWYTDQSAVAAMLTGNALPLSPPLQVSSNPTYPGCWALDTQPALLGQTSSIMSTLGDPHLTGAGYQIIAEYMLSQLAPGVVGSLFPSSAHVALTTGTPGLLAGTVTTVSPSAGATVALTAGAAPTLSMSVNVTAVPASAHVAVSGSVPSLAGTVMVLAPSGAHIAITTGTPMGLAKIPQILTLVPTTNRRFTLLNL